MTKPIPRQLAELEAQLSDEQLVRLAEGACDQINKELDAKRSRGRE